jgi:hypothetical protein
MKQMAASADNQETAEENGAPGAAPLFVLDLARLSSGICQFGQSEPATNYATGNDHPLKDEKKN